MSISHMTTIHGSATDHAATINPLAQLRAARHKPVAALIGATAGLVPVGVYEVGHYELTSWSPLECPKAVIVYAGLLFSALTVLGWSANMFGSKIYADIGIDLVMPRTRLCRIETSIRRRTQPSMRHNLQSRRWHSTDPFEGSAPRSIFVSLGEPARSSADRFDDDREQTGLCRVEHRDLRREHHPMRHNPVCGISRSKRSASSSWQRG